MFSIDIIYKASIKSNIIEGRHKKHGSIGSIMGKYKGSTAK